MGHGPSAPETTQLLCLRAVAWEGPWDSPSCCGLSRVGVCGHPCRGATLRPGVPPGEGGWLGTQSLGPGLSVRPHPCPHPRRLGNGNGKCVRLPRVPLSLWPPPSLPWLIPPPPPTLSFSDTVCLSHFPAGRPRAHPGVFALCHVVTFGPRWPRLPRCSRGTPFSCKFQTHGTEENAPQHSSLGTFPGGSPDPPPPAPVALGITAQDSPVASVAGGDPAASCGVQSRVAPGTQAPQGTSWAPAFDAGQPARSVHLHGALPPSHGPGTRTTSSETLSPGLHRTRESRTPWSPEGGAHCAPVRAPGWASVRALLRLQRDAGATGRQVTCTAAPELDTLGTCALPPRRCPPHSQLLFTCTPQAW